MPIHHRPHRLPVLKDGPPEKSPLEQDEGEQKEPVVSERGPLEGEDFPGVCLYPPPEDEDEGGCPSEPPCDVLHREAVRVMSSSKMWSPPILSMLSRRAV